MRKPAVLGLILLLLLPMQGAAKGEESPVGFGYIQTNQTNLREDVGGRILFKLDAGDSLYVTEQTTDGQGMLWYHVNTEVRDKPRSAWVQAKYVLAGDQLFHDVVQIAACETGMLALQSDGHVAGVADENVGTRVFEKQIARWDHVRQVACGFMTYLGLREDGSLRGFGNLAFEDWNAVRNVRLLAAERGNVAYVTEDGRCNMESYQTLQTIGAPLDWLHVKTLAAGNQFLVAVGDGGALSLIGLEQIHDEFLAAGEWTDLLAVDAGIRTEVLDGLEGRIVHDTLIALRRDGTVLVLPDGYAAETRDWTDLATVKAGWDCVLGLRNDGTVVAAGEDAAIVSGVQSWRDIVAVEGSKGYCVGLHSDGTLVFAGAYVY